MLTRRSFAGLTSWMNGYRNTRTDRAPMSVNLRPAGDADLDYVRALLRKGMRKHETEAQMRSLGIRATRNMLSQLEGARP